MNSVLYPKWSSKHLINIDNKMNNPNTEHKVDILDRLNPKMVIGKGSQLIIKVNKYKKKYMETIIFMLIKYYLNNKYNTYIEWQRIQKITNMCANGEN